jgi:uncharacterized protein
LAITAVYAGLLALLLVVLSVRVIGVRRTARIAVGDQGDALLLRRMRAQANFTEYVPMALVLMALSESLSAPTFTLHGMGALLLIGRLIHAIGISRVPEPFVMRVSGMVMTFAAILVAAATSMSLGAMRLISG